MITGVIASHKGRSTGWWEIYGLALGPIALVHALVTHTNDGRLEEDAIATGLLRKCPYCTELVKPEALICRHCRSELPPLQPTPVLTPRVPGTTTVAPEYTDAANQRTGIIVMVGVLSLLGLTAFGLSLRPDSKAASDASNVLDECAKRGDAFSKTVAAETWPKLGDGRDGHSVAVSRCQESPSAF